MSTTSSPPSIPDKETILALLHTVIDPEAGMNIVDLGLLYDLMIEDDTVRVAITMTSPACPMGDMILDDVEAKLRRVIASPIHLDIQLVWSPPWDPSMMSEEARQHFAW